MRQLVPDPKAFAHATRQGETYCVAGATAVGPERSAHRLGAGNQGKKHAHQLCSEPIIEFEPGDSTLSVVNWGSFLGARQN